jgi:hypothetical protein
MLNEGNQIYNFILWICENLCDTIYYGSRTLINYGSGSDFLKSYGSGSTLQKVTVPVPQHYFQPVFMST